jgi:hypothetical protein
VFAPTQLHVGDQVRFGAGRSVYVVEWLERLSGEHFFVIAHGPVGSFRARGGQAFYAGPGSLTRVSPITGETETLKPVRVRLVPSHFH